MSLMDVQTAAGAIFAPCPGGPPQSHFGDPAGEYAAARSAAALFDLSDRTQIEITGADRAKFLHNFCTNDVRGLQPGQGCEAFICNVQGKILGHVFVFAAPDSIVIDSVAGTAPALLKHLGKYHITEDVSFQDRTPDWGTLFVTGPQAATTLTGLGLPGESLALNAHGAAEWKGSTIYVRRLDWLTLPGWEVVAPRDQLADLWLALQQAGAKPAGSQAWQPLRLEACFPVYGVDIAEDNLAQEIARTGKAISFTKGCYLGQEPIARIDALGHVNGELRGIRFEAGPVPAPGTELGMAANATRAVGRITSSAFSYGTNAPVALAYMKRSFDTPGQSVRVAVGEETVAGVLFTTISEPK